MTLKSIAAGTALMLVTACNEAPDASPMATVDPEAAGPAEATDAVALAEDTIDNAMNLTEQPATSSDTRTAE